MSEFEQQPSGIKVIAKFKSRTIDSTSKACNSSTRSTGVTLCGQLLLATVVGFPLTTKADLMGSFENLSAHSFEVNQLGCVVWPEGGGIGFTANGCN